MKLFTEIEDVWKRTEGWCSLEKANTLASIALATRPAVCVEVGIWYGRSFLPVAQTLRFIGSGRAIAIDPWKASASIEGQVNPADQNWWNRQDIHDAAFRSFAESVDKLQLSRFVEIHRKSSDDIEPPNGIGLLSIDGNHGDQVLKDVENYAPKVSFGGFIVMDDLNWSGGSVTRAAVKLEEMGFLELYRVVNDKENWACFQRFK